MRLLKRFKKPLYYALSEGKKELLDENGDETGDIVDTFSVPVPFYANISPNKGSASAEPFGLSLDYTKTIMTTEDLPISEGTHIWQSTTPPDGENDGETADYVVMQVAQSFNVTTYAVKQLTKNG